VYRPNDRLPEALLDQLADIAGNLPISENSRVNRNYYLRLVHNPLKIHFVPLIGSLISG
jgi:hypothetical protein